jgi:hypothetical protein
VRFDPARPARPGAVRRWLAKATGVALGSIGSQVAAGGHAGGVVGPRTEPSPQEQLGADPPGHRETWVDWDVDAPSRGRR